LNFKLRSDEDAIAVGGYMDKVLEEFHSRFDKEGMSHPAMKWLLSNRNERTLVSQKCKK
jgi:hypothetical protein